MNVIQQAIDALIIGLDYVKSEQFQNSQAFKGYEHLAPNDDLCAKEIEEAINEETERCRQIATNRFVSRTR